MEEVKKLSQEEKISLVLGDGAWHTNAVGDIPATLMTDGPHGLRKQDDGAEINDSIPATCFPTACAVASSWNLHNAAKVAECIAEEAIEEGVDLVLGPGLNIKRSPLCGRNFEYFSEDPCLSGHMAAAYVNGMQKRGVGSCLKHFAVNSQETRRMTIDAVVDERALREIYLSAFEYAVKHSAPFAVMASYNKINGTSATENTQLLNTLRREWKFDGIVISDWGASYNTPAALAAGTDLEMPQDKSGYHRKTLEAALSAQTELVQPLDEACCRLATYANKCRQPKLNLRNFVHHKVCVEVAADSAVLLKNNAILPLSATDDVCVIGALAQTPRFQGAGSSHINAQCQNFLQVTEQQCNKTLPFAKGYNIHQDKTDEALLKEAVQLASCHQTVLFFGGLTDIFESEGYDRTSLAIPQNQQYLLECLSKVCQHIVFVAFAGSPFEMPWLEKVSALLHMHLGGEGVMQAAYQLLFGQVSPSGRLAETYPVRLQDTPCFQYFASHPVYDEHRESIFVGYRYYDTFNIPVQFPFGYGMSYTKFKYSNLQVSPLPQGFEVTFCVKNVGNFDAAEVVQLYVDNPRGNIMRAKRELKEFCKIFLRSGESQEVGFVLSARDFSVFWQNKFCAVNGTYAISVCKNVRDTLLSAEVDVKFGCDIAENQRETLPEYFAQTSQIFTVSDQTFQRLVKKTPHPQCKRGTFTLKNTLEDLASKTWLIRVVLKHTDKHAVRHSPTKRPDDPVAKMTSKGARETPLISLMSIGGVSANYVLFMLHFANRRYFKALAALCGNWKVVSENKIKSKEGDV